MEPDFPIRFKAVSGHEGECHTHGKPDIITGRRPGVKLENNKSFNLRVRGKERAKQMRLFKNGFVISYLICCEKIDIARSY